MGSFLKLSVYRGAELIDEQDFDRDIIKIGRLASAHLRLDDNKVSRIHAVIETSSDGSQHSIIDMGSTEGTYVNGQKISKEILRDKDELTLGDFRVVVSLEEGGKVATADLVAESPLQTPSAPARVVSTELWTATPQELAAHEGTGVLPMSAVPSSVGGAGLAPAPMPSGYAPQYQGAAVMPWQASGAAPMSGAPMSGAPMSGAPMSGVPMSGAPMSSASMSGAPMSGVPMSGAPMSSVPMSGVPMSGAAPSTSVAPMSVPPSNAFSSVGRSRVSFDPWGSVPSNLASESVPDSERALEIKTIWGLNTVIDTLTASKAPRVTLGDERKVSGFGPFQKVVRCDIEVPSKGLPSSTWLFAERMGGEGAGATYSIHIPKSFEGRLERADGTVFELDDLARGARGASNEGDGIVYPLQAAETLLLRYGNLTFQIRYVRRVTVLPLGIFDSVNYAWLNALILAFFFHAVAIASFLATPRTQVELTEDIFKNPNRFAQVRLTPEEKKKLKANDLLSKLKAGEVGAKAKGAEGKAGRTDYDKNKKQGRMAVKGDPDKKEIAKNTLSKLFGATGNTGRSYLFGSGGLGGELKGALGGVTGAEIGDASGLGGLGTRGTGPGGGGLSMDSVGLGALGTHGRGGGGTGYGEGIGGIGKKVERDINISAGSPLVMGSLDKEIIRRVIKQHIAQIRYCYEKELVRAPGLFGKVATKFVISADGAVQSADVTESTLGNAEVERCVVSKIRTWRFPKPKGGGIVVVKYPFIFKTTG
ncbi:MAG: TonB family protein [Deltaproteobacteria bacterium]|nr:TonB family protein [Deltaproteobacteria bacterium]